MKHKPKTSSDFPELRSGEHGLCTIQGSKVNIMTNRMSRKNAGAAMLELMMVLVIIAALCFTQWHVAGPHARYEAAATQQQNVAPDSRFKVAVVHLQSGMDEMRQSAATGLRKIAARIDKPANAPEYQNRYYANARQYNGTLQQALSPARHFCIGSVCI
jgi:Tfp pilus assembly protein PilX